MYIMLVDDEFRICSGLASMLRKKWPDLRIGKFDNGYDALASIREECPDFLLTDINMPGMNGLELIEKAQALALGYYAILTGYDEFELVQKALRLQAIDYLMKPVDIPQLYGLVEKIMNLKEEEEQNRMKSMEMLLRLYVLLPQEQAQVIQRPSLQELCPNDGKIFLAVGEPESEDNPRLLFGESFRWLMLGEDMHRCPVFLTAPPEEQLESLEAKAKELMDTGDLTGYAVGHVDLDSLHALYLSAREGGADAAERLGHLAEKKGLSDAETAAGLEHALSRYPAVFDRIELMFAFVRAVHRLYMPWNDLETMSQWNRLDEKARKEWTESFLAKLESLPRPETQEVRTAMDIVTENLSTDLKPGDMAGLVHMNASYFSTLFHRETGMTLVDYINTCRICASILHLLRFPELSIDAAAEGVGFANAQYFHRVFKTMTGMTPNGLRQKITDKV